MLLSLAMTSLSVVLLRSPQGTSIVNLPAGVTAGILILLPMRRWWPFLIVGAAGQYAYYAGLGLSIQVTALRTLADVVAVVVYVLVIRRWRRPDFGLGAPLWIVVVAAFASAAIREVPIALVGLAGAPADAVGQRTAALLVFVGSVVGIMCGSAVVLGLARWREARDWAGWHSGIDLALMAGLAVALWLAFLTPAGANVPGAQYLVVAIMMVAAVRLPIPLTALVTALATLGVASAANRGVGAFDRPSTAGLADLLAAQAYLLVLVTSMFLLAATIDQQRRAQQAAARSGEVMQAMFEGSPVPSAWVRVHADGRIQVREANAALTCVLGVPKTAAAGAHLEELLLGPGKQMTAADLVGADHRFTLADGRAVWLRSSLSSLGSPQVPNGSDPWILVCEDVTAARTSEEMLRRQTFRDPLTGLPNRAMFLERVDRQVADGGRSSVGVVLLDVDGMRRINDSLGYPYGDQVLVHVAQQLREHTGDDDFVARISGDEFVIIRDDEADQHALDRLADKLLAVVCKPLSLAGQSLVVTASAGLAFSDDGQATEAHVLRRADAAISQAKTNGRNTVARYAVGQDTQALIRLTLEAGLRSALDDHSLVCHFQPIVDMATGHVAGAETLVRLRGSDHALVPPLLFVPLAAELGLLGQLTEQVIDQACAAAACWRATGRPEWVSVNAPPSWLTPQATDYLTDRLAAHGLPGAALTLEVTEDESMNIDATQAAVLSDLRSAGLLVAIDDFGTGYAGLGSFRSLPADLVKIDQSFVAAMLDGDEDTALVRSILDLVHRFGKKAIAEGIETPEQYSTLAAMGCDYGQGYLVGRPVPAGQMATTPFCLPSSADPPEDDRAASPR